MNLFQTELVYTNGVSVSAKLMKQVETISSDPVMDRTYINAQFFIFFPEKIILERIEMGLSREDVLLEFRESDRYAIMKGMFCCYENALCPIFSDDFDFRNHFICTIDF